jgi:hypothetical protein
MTWASLLLSALSQDIPLRVSWPLPEIEAHPPISMLLLVSRRTVIIRLIKNLNNNRGVNND